MVITVSLRSSNQACYVFQSSLTPLDNGEANQRPPSPKEKPEHSCNTKNTKDVEQLKSGSNEGTESPDAKPNESSDVDSDEDLKLKPC
jgi:hypothetical protein